MLREQIADDMRAAMKAREQVRVDTLRMLMTAVKNVEVERGHELADDEVTDVVAKEAKRRRESIEAFKQGGRDDLVDKEAAQLAVLDTYLPEAMSDDELARIVDEAIAGSGATSAAQMGLVMKAVMPKVRGRADGSAVSAMVKKRLGA